MNRTDKAQVIERLAERIAGSPTIYLTDFTGLNVERITEFRRRLRAAGVEYQVVKNTLVERAMAPELLEQLQEHLVGPTAMVFAGEDPIEAARVVAGFQKEFDKPTVKVGLIEGRSVSAEYVAKLAKLPPRPELMAQLGGVLQAPLAAMVGAMNGLLYNVVGALEALRAQREGAES